MKVNQSQTYLLSQPEQLTATHHQEVDLINILNDLTDRQTSDVHKHVTSYQSLIVRALAKNTVK